MHIMVDIETLATGRDAAILSIGAVPFAPETGEIFDDRSFYERINLADSVSPGVIDPSTVEWWMGQSDAAREALFQGPRRTLRGALVYFDDWVRGIHPNAHRYGSGCRLWSNGPTFDEMILRDAFARYDLSFPVHFTGSRCCRTLLDLARKQGYQFKKHKREGTRHDALADAIFQARGVRDMYRFLNPMGASL